MKVIIPMFIPLHKLPPALTLLKSIASKQDIEIHVITISKEEQYQEFFHDLNIKVHYLFEYNWYENLKEKNFASQIYNRELKLNKLFYKKLNEIYDFDSLVWIIHEETAFYLSKKITKYRYIFSIYELNNNIKKYKLINSNVKYIGSNAMFLVVPELSRAHIIKSWWNLKETPLVLPNKPYEYQNTESNLIVKGLLKSLKNKKMILYQGAFGYDRKLDTIIRAFNQFEDEYEVVLLGRKNDYVNKLEEIGLKFVHIDSLPAPTHLSITKHAHIGILSYVPNVDTKKYEPLNAIFCAPNKIYEFGGYGIPMLGNNMPGLINTIEKYNAGVCVDINNIENICKSIEKIETNYAMMSANARKLFLDCDVDNIVSEILEKSKSLWGTNR